MKLPKQFTTITPFSKSVAMILFIILPFLSLFLGISYQSKIDSFKMIPYSPAICDNQKIQENMQKEIKPYKPGWTVFNNGRIALSLPPSWYVKPDQGFQKNSDLVIIRGDELKNDKEDPNSHDVYLVVGRKQYVGSAGLQETQKTTWLQHPALLQLYSYESYSLVLSTQVNNTAYEFDLRTKNPEKLAAAKEKFLEVASTIQIF